MIWLREYLVTFVTKKKEEKKATQIKLTHFLALHCCCCHPNMSILTSSIPPVQDNEIPELNYSNEAEADPQPRGSNTC